MHPLKQLRSRLSNSGLEHFGEEVSAAGAGEPDTVYTQLTSISTYSGRRVPRPRSRLPHQLSRSRGGRRVHGQLEEQGKCAIRDTGQTFGEVKRFLFLAQFLHVMRDHPAHGAYIMAGMWGARLDNSEVRRRFLVAFTDMFQVSAFLSECLIASYLTHFFFRGSGELRVRVARGMGPDSADALRVAVVQKV